MEKKFTNFDNLQKWLVDNREVPEPVAVEVAPTLFAHGYIYPSSLLNIEMNDLNELKQISRPHKNILFNKLQQQQQQQQDGKSGFVFWIAWTYNCFICSPVTLTCLS